MLLTKKWLYHSVTGELNIAQSSANLWRKKTKFWIHSSLLKHNPRITYKNSLRCIHAIDNVFSSYWSVFALAQLSSANTVVLGWLLLLTEFLTVPVTPISASFKNIQTDTRYDLCWRMPITLGPLLVYYHSVVFFYREIVIMYRYLHGRIIQSHGLKQMFHC